MSAALNSIQAAVDAAHCRESCSRDRCQVDLTGAPSPRLIVDADSVWPALKMEDKRCDFILFLSGGGGVLTVAPIELKSGDFGASQAVDQLQAGAAFAHQVLPSAARTECRPILFCKSIHRKQRADLARGKVNFRGRKITVKIARCGQPGNLARVLEA